MDYFRAVSLAASPEAQTNAGGTMDMKKIHVLICMFIRKEDKNTDCPIHIKRKPWPTIVALMIHQVVG